MEAALSIETHLPCCVIVAHNTTHLIQSVQCFSFLNIIILLIWGRFCSFITKQVMFQIDTAEPFGAQRQHILAFEWLSFVRIISLPYSIFHKSHCKTAWYLSRFLFIIYLFFCLAAGRMFKELNEIKGKGGWSLPVCFFFSLCMFLPVYYRRPPEDTGGKNQSWNAEMKNDWFENYFWAFPLNSRRP